jgi:misacylated tRNA(Ala) deacylase
MGVPGNPPPAGLAETELFAVDAYRTEFDATVTEVDHEGGRVRLAIAVTGVRRGEEAIWHTVDAGDVGLPAVGAEVQGEVD